MREVKKGFSIHFTTLVPYVRKEMRKDWSVVHASGVTGVTGVSEASGPISWLSRSYDMFCNF